MSKSTRRRNAAHVRASIDIAAPPAVVWGVITDCARQPQIIPNLESCRIVKHDAGGRWDVREHIINWAALMPKLRTVVRTSYEIGHRMLFKRVDGDMRISEGEWRVEPLANASKTRLLLRRAGGAELSGAATSLVERAIHADLPELLRAVRSRQSFGTPTKTDGYCRAATAAL